MKLTPTTVKELTQLRAEIKKLQTKEKKLTESLKKEMASEALGEYAPASSPYKLVLLEYIRSKVSWKREWRTLAKKTFGKKWRKKELELVVDSEENVSSLTIEPNERYKKNAA